MDKKLRHFSRVVKKYFSFDTSHLSYQKESGYNPGLSWNFSYNFVDLFHVWFYQKFSLDIDARPYVANTAFVPGTTMQQASIEDCQDGHGHNLAFICFKNDQSPEAVHLLLVPDITKKKLVFNIHAYDKSAYSAGQGNRNFVESALSDKIYCETSPAFYNTLINAIETGKVLDPKDEGYDIEEDEFCENKEIEEKMETICRPVYGLTSAGKAKLSKDIDIFMNALMKALDVVLHHLNGRRLSKEDKLDFEMQCNPVSNDEEIHNSGFFVFYRLFLTTANEHFYQEDFENYN